jgi:hypothetical protein
MLLIIFLSTIKRCQCVGFESGVLV